MIYVLCSLDHCTVLCCYWYFSKNSYDTYKPTLNDNNFKKTPTKIKTNIITIIVIIIIIIIMVMVMVSTLFIYLFIFFDGLCCDIFCLAVLVHSANYMSIIWFSIFKETYSMLF